MNIKINIKHFLIITTLISSLQGCVFVAGATAGAAGIAVVYDHRKVEKVLLDQHIATTITDNIHQSKELSDNTHIEVTCFNQIVLLSGEATNTKYATEAEHIARAVPDVTKVYNQLTIKGATSSLTRASDAWITTKIKTEMLATKNLSSGSIKVVTENGTVFLMGIVNRDQANTAVDISRQVSGVQKVIKIFQYTN